MVFEKKWTDEQNKEILDLHKRISNDEIAKKFKISATNVSKRISYLKKLEKKQTKSKPKKKSQPKAKSQKNEKIEVMTAPTHDNADELMKEYQVDPINKEESEEVEEEKTKEEPQEETQGGQVNWTGVSDTLTIILDKRFVANELAPLTEEEKKLFASALNQTLELRAQFYFQYADVVNLALAGFAIMSPRIFEFLDRKKQATESTATATVDLSAPEAPQEAPVTDELAEATKRFEAMQTPQ